MTLPTDYEERVYAGVLGKVIGVYLGRPIEGWTYERVAERFGEVTGYVHEQLGRPLVLTDDDISGTFTFFRALEDAHFDGEVSAEAIGRGWLNYLIEGRTTHWWGGLGNSTENTAYLRLKAGIPAPRSGSVEVNGRIVAEQIGAQIFMDAWAMASPGDPERAAAFASRAASVSHGGEAIHAAAFFAALEAQAFVESDIDALFDVGLACVPRDATVVGLASDLREWRRIEPDWRKARRRLVARYGEGRFGGNVHIIPQQGSMLLSVLWGDDDVSRTLSIVNTCGGDTDCNSGNVGCLMGIKNGLPGLAGPPEWRAPVADRMYVVSAEGGRGVTDAVTEAGRIAAAGRRLVGDAPVVHKDGARYHFSFPGSVQGFAVAADARDARGVANVQLGEGEDGRMLAVPFAFAGSGTLRAVTPTFIPPYSSGNIGYPLMASPSIHPGQALRASVRCASDTPGPIAARLTIGHYVAADDVAWVRGPERRIDPGVSAGLDWEVPSTDGQPIVYVGVEVAGEGTGTLLIDWLTWDGSPTVSLGRPSQEGSMWRRAWVDGVDHWETFWPEAYRIGQDRGTGLLMQGSLDWTDYRVEAEITPRMAAAAGIAARVGGMRRYYGLLLAGYGRARLVKVRGDETTLAEAAVPWESFTSHRLAIEVVGSRITCHVDDTLVADVTDAGPDALDGGGIGLICQEGTLATNEVRVSALPAQGS